MRHVYSVTFRLTVPHEIKFNFNRELECRIYIQKGGWLTSNQDTSNLVIPRYPEQNPIIIKMRSEPKPFPLFKKRQIISIALTHVDAGTLMRHSRPLAGDTGIQALHIHIAELLVTVCIRLIPTDRAESAHLMSTVICQLTVEDGLWSTTMHRR